MGLLSGLLKIGGAIAAPFTGGASLLATGLGAAGDIAGKAAGGAAAGRQAESQALLSRDQLANQQYGIKQGAEMNAGQLDLQRKNFSEGARGDRAKQALIASILGGGFQPTNVSVPGVKNATITGGLGESIKNPGAQAAMQELMKQALAAQLAGDTFTGGKVLDAPTISQVPKAGLLEKVLGGVGLGGSLIGGVNAAVQGARDASTKSNRTPPFVDPGVDVMGAIPGGAMTPRTAQPTLPSTSLEEILARIQAASNGGQ